MPIELSHNAYGKYHVRVSKIKRPRQGPANRERHELIEAAVDVLLEGDFAASYTAADNRNVIATDTCRNTIYVLAKEDPLATIESFGLAVARHFLQQYAQVTSVTVSLREQLWQRLLDSPHAFVGSSRETPTAVVTAGRDQPPVVAAGLAGLVVAKTTETGFANFHRDQYRTLEDTDDRILATELSASWEYASDAVDFVACREAVRGALLRQFIDHYSHSVQETLYLMGRAALDAAADVTQITLTMPNKHHLLFPLDRFGLANENEVFVATDEPFGYITGTVSR